MSTSHSPPPSNADFPPLSCADVLACRFSSWYPTFRKHSPKATILKPLEERFIAYLESDRVFLPEGSGPVGVSELSDDDGNGSDSSQDLSWQLRFTELDAQIRRVIVKYDGAVFPKLNWSSPQDAAWMMPGSTLKCQSPADVYLLLKSSDFISHDLEHAFESCFDAPSEPDVAEEDQDREVELVEVTAGVSLDDDSNSDSDSSGANHRALRSPTRRKPRPYDFELVLKKWFEMPRSQEWRCFVRDRTLIAISQRDTNYYGFLQGEAAQAEVRDKISLFFDEHILPHFPSTSYTFDVYFTRSNDRLFIVDFNPYAPQTDSLLLSWPEIHALATVRANGSLPVVQVVSNETMAAQSMPSFSHNRYPKDVVDLSSGASIAEFAEKWRGALEDGVLGSDAESTTGSARSLPGR